MQTAFVFTTLALAAALPAFAADPIEETWNLAEIYTDTAAWDKDALKVEAQLKEFAKCRGHVGETVARFKACMDLQADLGKRYARLDTYASELLSADTGSSSSLALSQRSQLLNTAIDEATAFLRPEVLKLGAAKVNALLAQDKSLAIYRHPLDELLRDAPHTLDARGEEIVATLGLTAGAANSAYTILANADMPWPTVKLADGRELRIDPSAYTEQREAANREDRKKVMDAFFGAWKTYERTIGVTFYESLKKDSAYSRVRRYKDSLERALDRNKLPVAVYDTLIKEANENLPTLHRYFRLRAKMLGITDAMRYYDIYPPLVKSDLKYPIALGKSMTLEAVKPLGPEYVAAMQKGFNERWMDTYPRPQKQSGAHMAGTAYDVHPYVLMNYFDNYDSVTTVAHEWGHAMHSYLTNRAQPFITSDYATFIAEIASTCNEALLLQSVLAKAKDDNERLLYLGSALENLRGTFFRQAMFADFEREVHARVDRGESLTGEAFTKIYGDILRRYHGEKEGVVKIDDLYAVEWAYIPHFYNAFYVFQYATSLAASSRFAEAILKGEPGARERYLKLLGAGSSDYPYELVKRAGVDLASPAPYKAVVARMNRIMDEIEAIQAKRK